MFGCGTETVDSRAGLNGSARSNFCTVFPNQLLTYMLLPSWERSMSGGSASPSSGPSTCWKS